MAVAVRCLAATYYDGFHIKPHRHHWGQLIYAGAGGTIHSIPFARTRIAPAPA